MFKLWTRTTVIGALALVCVSANSVRNFDFSPPEPQEWEVNPNIFEMWPKIEVQESKSSVKSPIESEIHKYLPGTTKPIDYLIRISMNLDVEDEVSYLKAPGSVQILIKCVQATSEIVLHADVNYVTILENATVVSESLLGKPTNRLVPIINQTYELDNNFYIIQLGSQCKVHREYVVEIHFVAEIATDSFTGLYLSTYQDPETNVTKRLATTQFESEHARQMFPNYDDPSYKATFRLIVGREAKFNSMSNMNIIKTEVNKGNPGWYWDHYAPTPIMSSYLVAVVVSEFTCVDAPPPGYKKHVNVCGPPHMIARGGGIHSAKIVAEILEFYDTFMKQEYPLPKMTSVAIPDFQAGAMENWGLNTYRIKGLIFYPNETSEEARYRIDLTVAHELAHQNWGNLVTTKLWNQIWLNEGFATYISYFGLKCASPEYDPDQQWMSGYRRRALLIDGSLETHPIVNVSSPKFFFDQISYAKGASLLKMMENFLTPKVFHEALRTYLAKHAYGSTTQWDLFDVIERQAVTSGVRPQIASITEIMESWTLQPGYPVLRVDYVSNRAILVTQERYIDTPQEGIAPASLWYIPITTVHDNSQTSVFDTKVPSIWLSNTEPSKLIYTESDFSYILVNPDASVYGRVLYDNRLTQLLAKQLNNAHDAISTLTRAQILEDAFELAWAGYGRVETALNYTNYLGKEVEPLVWSAAMTGLGRIYSMFSDDDEVLPHFKGYVYERITASLAAIGVEQKPHEKGVPVMHRGSLLHWAGILEIPEALDHAIGQVHSWVNTSVNRVTPDLHSQTYCNAIIGGEEHVYEHLFKFAQEVSNSDVRQAIIRGLGCSKSDVTLKTLRFNLTREGFEIGPDSSFDLMLKLARNRIARKDLVQYLDDNFNTIQGRYEGVFIIAKSLEVAAQYWNTQEQLNEVKDFIGKYRSELEDMTKTLKRVVLQIRNNISWMERFSDDVKTWFVKQNNYKS